MHFGRLNGRSSRWFGYIQSLPDSIVDLPLFWGMECLTDHQVGGRIAELEWLRGTEVLRCLWNSEFNLQVIVSHRMLDSAMGLMPTLNLIERVLLGNCRTVPFAAFRGTRHSSEKTPQLRRLLSCIFARFFQSIPGRCVPWTFHGAYRRCVSGVFLCLNILTSSRIVSTIRKRTTFICRYFASPCNITNAIAHGL